MKSKISSAQRIQKCETSTNTAKSSSRSPLRLISNQSNIHFKEKAKQSNNMKLDANKLHLRSKIEAIKHFQQQQIQDLSSSSDEFDDDDYRSIMAQFNAIENNNFELERPNPTSEQIEALFLRNTMLAKESSRNSNLFNKPERNIIEFGRVQ